jgi:hypothetical protein
MASVDTSLSKMAFSEAYVGAVASAAGFVFEPDRIDLASIDGTIKGGRVIERAAQMHVAECSLGTSTSLYA